MLSGGCPPRWRSNGIELPDGTAGWLFPVRLTPSQPSPSGLIGCLRPIPKKYPPLPRFPHTVHEKTLFGRSAKEVSLLSSKDQGCSTNLHRGTSPTTCRRNGAPKLFTSSRCRKADTKKAASLLQLTACFCCGAPEEIRTPGLQVRSLLLYPAELRARREGVLIEMRIACQQSWGKKTIFFESLLRGAVSRRHLVGSPILEDLLKKHSIPYADIDRMLAEPRLAFQILKKRPSPHRPFPAYLHARQGPGDGRPLLRQKQNRPA